jgi:hypothetical protein
MDEAFYSFHRIVEDMIPAGVDFTDDDGGVHSYMTRLSIESPVELDVTRGDGHALEIGSTPPLYYVATSSLPSFHRIRFTVELTHESDGR